MAMDKISEVILDKVKAESGDIIKEAQDEARERIEKAREQHNARFEEEKNKLLKEADGEASRIQAQASITARQEFLKVKNEVINEIVDGLKKRLPDIIDGDKLAINLIKEGMEAIDADEVIAYVSPRDIEGVKKLIEKDPELSSRVKDVRKVTCLGGAIVEDIAGKMNIDNTYDTRLNTLLPRILPEISEELFGSS